ncbi:MAG: hypothetical protein ACT4O0_18140 [Pseudonocardia sp.]
MDSHLSNWAAKVMAGMSILLLSACATPTPGSPPNSAGTAVPTTERSRDNAQPEASSLPSARKPGEIVISGLPRAYYYSGDDAFATVAYSAEANGDVVTVYSSSGQRLTTTPAPLSPGGDCGLAILRQSTERVIILSSREEETPPQGLVKGVIEQKLDAFDAATLEKLWTATISTVPSTGESVRLHSCSIYSWTLEHLFRGTKDGKYGLATFGKQSVVVDLNTGQAKPASEAIEVVGNWLARTDPDPQKSGDFVALTDPWSGAVYGRTDSREIYFALSSRLYSNSADMILALSPDATIAVIQEQGLSAYRLPAFQKIWHRNYQEASGIGIFTQGDQAAEFAHPTNGPHGSVAVDISSGSPLWRIDAGQVCLARGNTIAIIANNQLVFVNARSGEQISYNPDVTQCPRRLGDQLLLSIDQDLQVMNVSSQ